MYISTLSFSKHRFTSRLFNELYLLVIMRSFLEVHSFHVHILCEFCLRVFSYLSPLSLRTNVVYYYFRFLQELQHSGKQLDAMYNESRNCTYAFKEKYDFINKTKRQNAALREIYYNALQTKKKHEDERDRYFQV